MISYLLGEFHGFKARFKGVCYFDLTEKKWTICNLNGRATPRHASPIAEHEAFTVFDDARCRGADLQLRDDAVALLTLGPKITKDKLMQVISTLDGSPKQCSVDVYGHWTLPVASRDLHPATVYPQDLFKSFTNIFFSP